MKPLITHNISILQIDYSSPEQLLQKSIKAEDRKDFLRRVRETTRMVEKLEEMLKVSFNPNYKKLDN